MTSHADVVQALADALRSEREFRVQNLLHAIKSLRGTTLMIEALLFMENDSQKFYNLEAVQTHVNDIQLWLEEQLQSEAEREPITNKETDETTIH
jgi:hypothetical protein